MRLSTAVALALSVLLAALTVGTVVIAPATAATSTADESAALSASQSRLASATLESSVQDADQEYEPERADTWQVIRLNVTEDGDVRWTLESRFRLSENETDQFERYAEAVANGDRDVGYDADQYDKVRFLAERSTDREMAFENDSWNDPQIESRDGRRVGIISYSFTWTNFAVVDGQQVHFGDAFVTDDGGVWLRSLEDGQRLVVESPPNHIPNTVSPTPTGIENGTFVYEGPKSFTEESLEMEFSRTDSPGGSGGTPSGPEPLSESVFTAEGIAAAFGGFVLVIVGTALLISRYQRSAWPFDDESPTGAEHPRATETDGSGTALGASKTDPPGIEHEFDETEAVDARPNGDTDDAIDEELLSDDERVRRLLEQNGGRMKQATIVKETGWSDAKVSQLLSEMDDDDRIRKLRIGRENLITLPDIDPTEID